MSSQRYVKGILYLAALVWAAALWMSGQQLQPSWLRIVSTVVTVVAFVALLFEQWLWKLSFLHSWFVKRPVIAGTWRAVIRSNWKNPETGKGIAPVEGFMVVRQTLTSLSCRLLTAESNSELVGTEIVCATDGVYCVSGVYRNEPRLAVRKRSPIHFGAVWLRVIDEPTKQMLGHYWTDRDTAGELELFEHDSKKLQSFDAAVAHFAKLSGASTKAALPAAQEVTRNAKKAGAKEGP